MTILVGNHSRLVMPGLTVLFGDSYKDFPTEYTGFMEERKSTQRIEELQGLSGFGLAVEKDEASPIAKDHDSATFNKKYVSVVYGLGFDVSREAIEDNLYAQVAAKRTKNIARALQRTKEYVAANILNRAFTNTYTGADGIELCSTAHLLHGGGTFSNRAAANTDLNEAALEQAITDIGNFVDDRNLPIAISAQKLIVHHSQQFEAERILMGDMQVNSAENNLNALKKLGKLPQGYMLSHYMTDTDAWFIKTDAEDGLICFNRRAASLANETNESAQVMSFYGSERYVMGWGDARTIYGCPGV